MKTKLFIFLPAFLLVFAACSHGHSHDNAKETTAAVNLPQHQHQAGVKLDNGKKWKANPETTQGIQNMQVLVKKQLENEKKDAPQLQEKLNTEFKAIFQKCTMKGEAHDQLHNYLIPLKDNIKKLEAGVSQQALQDISAYLESYYKYFE